MNKNLIKLSQKLRENSIYFLYKYLKIEDFKYRKLTEGEIQIARKVFQNTINYNTVKIFNIPYLPWQPLNIIIAPNGNLFVNKELYSKDYSKCSITTQGIFIHELAHILQYQKHKNVVLRGFLLQSAYYLSLKSYNPYKYHFIESKPFEKYNIEQQGEIARDIFFDKIPNIITRS
ncbi:hypothetical protein F994_00966 [Acinetobacter bohemicus ANC 3994]|uniref:Uncharacterized protein n=1 Tax=Acinetobacter bohemicus ANC 3994 TaxID=1217715 RepID=N8QC23_9GAMM|nr:hypothetical protein [Acinetobacter bohemicus]ENU20733.1 hypothetical protein F994_00966 [Acinetobacter bohemicus ANC 3994]